MNPVRVFGYDHHDDLEIVPTPVGCECSWCGEEIVDGDVGQVMDFVGSDQITDSYWHLECFLRSIVGSVGHQKGTCHCYGGTEEDPEGMTMREAALAAYLYFKGKYPE